MTDTPGPCGCRVVETYPYSGESVIRYCPTHAAAFENEAKLEAALKREKSAVEVSRYWNKEWHNAEAQNADLLAALEEAYRVIEAVGEVCVVASTPGFMWRRMRELGPEIDAAYGTARAAIAKAKENIEGDK